MNQLSSLQASVLSLVKRFVRRQSIVLDAMRDLRPDIIMPLENRGDSIYWAELREKHTKMPQVGYWGENAEWEYFLHGGGCRLIHRETGERIEWDAGDLNRFNVDWFVIYLQWLLKYDHNNDEDIRTVRSLLQTIEVIGENPTEQIIKQHTRWRQQILPILEQLYENKLLSRNEQCIYYALTTQA